ncbi:winged helix-turn-helix domain-containing protein [Methanosarcina sp.]|uniref:helix-turn-helix transcriptional regulator n=1 Tax=Methanosarcina sp. TaxID=2213 RepID=UPI00298816B8|nr:winged helix-turn-helix domain-containing protein [Methanosarcina sp.]MDW5550047.1 winged helix-turn-helix domain-containing protein [Methanosarcina sp.]MDW5554001.1 winged helix-turn-helix domain-containing protein [Methanosarcina sp.]MDW5558494.1 winged helix-turn-helix domain-containing protein [Methanosarcina sp.]
MNSPLLELIFLSEKRKELLLFLKDGPKTISEIKENLNVGLVAILPQLKKLRESSLILKTGDTYSLAPLGIAVISRMKPMIDVLNVFESKYEYWATHAVESIPDPLRERIGELASCTFSEPPDRTHLFEPHREFVENLMKSKKISGIASIFHPLYPSLFLSFAKNGVDVSLLVTRPIYERLNKEYRAEMNEFLKFKNASFYVYDKKIELAYAVTDIFLSLTLPFSDGTYDHKEDVLCFDSQAIKWGEDLFAYYRKISDKITEMD